MRLRQWFGSDAVKAIVMCLCVLAVGLLAGASFSENRHRDLEAAAALAAYSEGFSNAVEECRAGTDFEGLELSRISGSLAAGLKVIAGTERTRLVDPACGR